VIDGTDGNLGSIGAWGFTFKNFGAQTARTKAANPATSTANAIIAVNIKTAMRTRDVSTRSLMPLLYRERGT